MQPFRTLAIVIGASLLVGVAAPATAQTKPARIEAAGAPIRSVLWIGNSFFYYNNSMHGHYNELANAADPGGKYRGTSVTISGSGLDWHDVASYLQPDGIGKYSFVPGNKIVFNPPGRQFDAVIMMDCSQCPIHPQLEGAFRESAKKDAAIVKKYGAQPMLFMSWVRPRLFGSALPAEVGALRPTEPTCEARVRRGSVDGAHLGRIGCHLSRGSPETGASAHRHRLGHGVHGAGV